MLLNELNTATKVRDVVSIIAQNVLKSQRPAATYASVVSVDTANKKVAVTFPGESQPVNVPYRTVGPYSGGAVVRIAGEPGDRYVDDVTVGYAQLDSQFIRVRALPLPVGSVGGTIQLDGGNSFSTTTWAVTNTSGELRFNYNGAQRLVLSANNAVILPAATFNSSLEVLGTCALRSTLAVSGVTSLNNQVNVTYANNGLDFGSAQILVKAASGARTGIAFWQSAYGVAPQLYCYGPNGNVISVTTSPGNTYAPIWASAFTVSSSERVKTNVVPLKPTEVGKPAQTTFRQMIKAIPSRRWTRAEPEMVLDVQSGVLREHVCGVDCNGTQAKPCSAVRNNRQPGIGLVAEEVDAVLPEAVVYDADMLPMGLDLAKVVGALWATVQELVDEVESFRSRGPAPR